MIKTIAVDDEPVALDIIKNHAQKVPFLCLEATFLSAADALAYIKKSNVDLIFLDISMPDISGLELASMIKKEVQIIFTTAYVEHALKGFDLAATDYLLKPINFPRFLQACQLAESRILAGHKKVPYQESLFVKDGHNWLQVRLSELLYIKGEDNYVSLFEKDRRILTRMTLAELQEKLPVGKFVRVHRSYIVALSKIEKIEKHQVTIGSEKIPLSMLSVESLLQLINS